jgi:Protein of unknown function (DUF1488)
VPLRKIAMALRFPNPCRSYDASRGVVRFWGYDDAMESLFLVDENMLRRLQPGARRDEEGLLNAFDLNRDLIHAAAVKAYRRGGDGFFHLIGADFGVNRA